MITHDLSMRRMQIKGDLPRILNVLIYVDSVVPACKFVVVVVKKE
jgi:hypothetical protein